MPSVQIYIDVDLPLTIRVAVDKRTKNPPFLYIFLNSLKHLQPKNVQPLLHEHGDNNTKVSCWGFFGFFLGFWVFFFFFGGAGGLLCGVFLGVVLLFLSITKNGLVAHLLSPKLFVLLCGFRHNHILTSFPVGVAGGVSTGVLLPGSGVGRNHHHGQLQQVQQQLSQVISRLISSSSSSSLKNVLYHHHFTSYLFY